MKTPYYVIHKEMLDEGIKKLKAALAIYWPNSIIGYSFKTNALPWVLDYMKQQGCYAEVVSEDEYELAEYMGYRQIIYNGPVKGEESFQRACQSGQVVNLDAMQELQWLEKLCQSAPAKPIKVGIRVNFDLESMCPGEASCGEEGGRFGFSYENGDFAKVVEALKVMPGIKVSGIHLHCSSKTRSLKIYQAIAKMACVIHRETRLALDYIDVGGGYFGGLSNKPQYQDYLCVITEILQEEYNPQETMLIVEPGTSLICPPIDYITTVTDVKETNRNYYVVTDGSRIHVDPLMTKKSYFYHIESVEAKNEQESLEKQVICGFTCMENDRLFTLEKAKPLQVGDKIIYEKVGAYTMCLSPLFIGYFPAVYLKEQEQMTCVREKWSISEVVQKALPIKVEV